MLFIPVRKQGCHELHKFKYIPRACLRFHHCSFCQSSPQNFPQLAWIVRGRKSMSSSQVSIKSKPPLRDMHPCLKNQVRRWVWAWERESVCVFVCVCTIMGKWHKELVPRLEQHQHLHIDSTQACTITETETWGCLLRPKLQEHEERDLNNRCFLEHSRMMLDPSLPKTWVSILLHHSQPESKSYDVWVRYLERRWGACGMICKGKHAVHWHKHVSWPQLMAPSWCFEQRCRAGLTLGLQCAHKTNAFQNISRTWVLKLRCFTSCF